MEKRKRSTHVPSSKLYPKKGLDAIIDEGDSQIQNITSKSWVVYNALTSSVVCGKNENEIREIASLTKIMTAYTAIKIIREKDLNLLTSKITVTAEVAAISGTSAKLEEGDSLTVWDMLHALMLPSGNDAAICIAEFFGGLLISFGTHIEPGNTNIDIFVKEMNINAKRLLMNNTIFANAHGLKDPLNKSTSLDIAKLSMACIDIPLLAEIIKKPNYSCVAKKSDGQQKTCVWTNTNKLVTKGFCGVKTGITASAGPCLSACYKDENHCLIIVVLSCKTSLHRWHEVFNLRNHAYELIDGKKFCPPPEKKEVPQPKVSFRK